ncbi:hypothetical protein [Desulfosarcina ovata]|nr:hypothetical protein [Desulfosarcina ovata]
MVVKASLLEELGSFQGLMFDIEKYLNRINLDYFYVDRQEAETNFSYKQIIPYVLLNYRDKFLCYLRGELTNEGRLKGNYSLGIGGHVNDKDENLFESSIDAAKKRELSEEISIKTKYTDHTIALINDDSNPVGRVHLGIISVLKLNEKKVLKKEKSINKINFISIEEMKTNIDKYESWSKIIIKDIGKISDYL